MERMGVIGRLCAAAGVGIVGTVCSAAVQYRATDLGGLPGQEWTNYEPMGVNNHGWVAGRAYDPGMFGEPFRGRAFLYGDGGMIDVGTLGGEYSEAFGINDGGQVVGASYTAAGELHAFVYESGAIRDLGTLPGGTSSSARGINNKGQVVSVATTAGGDEHAFLYSDGVMTDLGTLLPGATKTYAYSINDLGQVAGLAKVPAFGGGDYYRAFLYDHGGVTNLSEIGAGDFRAEEGLAINSTGQVTGRGVTLPDYSGRAFLYGEGDITNLGTIAAGAYSSARGLNAVGQVVGDASTEDSFVHAFLYSDGVMTDLNTLLVPEDRGWILSEAYAINDVGQIVGVGGSPEGRGAVFLLTPVPEPAVLGTLGVAALVLARRTAGGLRRFE